MHIFSKFVMKKIIKNHVLEEEELFYHDMGTWSHSSKYVRKYRGDFVLPQHPPDFFLPHFTSKVG